MPSQAARRCELWHHQAGAFKCRPTSVTEPSPSSTRKISVVGRSLGESHPPCVHAHEPTEAPSPLFQRGREKSSGSPADGGATLSVRVWPPGGVRS